MKSKTRGVSTSRQVEVTNVSPHGFWMLVGDREVYLPFSLFPWFERASIAEIGNVRLMSPAHLYWPDLDVDISTDSIEHPEKFPLVSRSEMRTKPA